MLGVEDATDSPNPEVAAKKLEVLAGTFEDSERLELDRLATLAVDETVRDPEAGLKNADPAIIEDNASDPGVAPLLAPNSMYELDVISEETLVLESSGILVGKLEGAFVSGEPEGILEFEIDGMLGFKTLEADDTLIVDPGEKVELAPMEKPVTETDRVFNDAVDDPVAELMPDPGGGLLAGDEVLVNPELAGVFAPVEIVVTSETIALRDPWRLILVEADGMVISG